MGSVGEVGEGRGIIIMNFIYTTPYLAIYEFNYLLA